MGVDQETQLRETRTRVEQAVAAVAQVRAAAHSAAANVNRARADLDKVRPPHPVFLLLNFVRCRYPTCTRQVFAFAGPQGYGLVAAIVDGAVVYVLDGGRGTRQASAGRGGGDVASPPTSRRCSSLLLILPV